MILHYLYQQQQQQYSINYYSISLLNYYPYNNHIIIIIIIFVLSLILILLLSIILLLSPLPVGISANLRSNIMDFGGFDSSRILILRGGIPRPIGNFPENLSQAIFVGIMLVGRLGVSPLASGSQRRTRSMSKPSVVSFASQDPRLGEACTAIFVVKPFVLKIPGSRLQTKASRSRRQHLQGRPPNSRLVQTLDRSFRNLEVGKRPWAWLAKFRSLPLSFIELVTGVSKPVIRYNPSKIPVIVFVNEQVNHLFLWAALVMTCLDTPTKNNNIKTNT